MSNIDNAPSPSTAGNLQPPPWQLVVRRLVIWGLFLLLVYVTRDFFFIAFMTFMFSYLALAVVGWGLKKWAPGGDRPRTRRLLTLGIFVLGPLVLLAVGTFVLPRLIVECQHLVGWVSRVSPEVEVARLIEGYIGPSEFRRQYGDASDPRYHLALAQFHDGGQQYVAEYLEFPKLEDWVDGGFHRHFAETERGRIRSRLLSEGTSSADFEDWFRTEEFPALKLQAASHDVANKEPNTPMTPLLRSAAFANVDELLQQARHNPEVLAALRQEWLRDSLDQSLSVASTSPDYVEQFREYYEDLRTKSPRAVPYTFEQFVELQKFRPQGPLAFGKALEKMGLASETDSESRLRADFEAAKKHELFQNWWSTSSLAKMVRSQMESNMAGQSSDRVEGVLASLLNIPLDLSTALLLSFFICIDFPGLQRAVRTLRDTWLRDVYDEVVPALSRLGLLVGQAMRAQGLIALCNAAIMFVALTMLRVEHSALLAGTVFVLCFVPSLGMLIAWALIVAVALIQPGGGALLALKTSGAVALVVTLETFVFSPRILGRLMELHPVLILAILPIAHYFFGVWGLILAVPVSVYIINEVILGGKRHVDEGPQGTAAIRFGRGSLGP
jgi:predicted PurR-regulated permease PerM